MLTVIFPDTVVNISFTSISNLFGRKLIVYHNFKFALFGITLFINGWLLLFFSRI